MLQQRSIVAGCGPALALLATTLGLSAGLKLDTPTPLGVASLYDKNGVDWVEGMCFSRERQSPVNFDTHIKDPPSDILKYHYAPVQNVKLQMQASNGLIFIDTSNLEIGSVAFNGNLYPLVRMDFHAGSEHLIRGKRYSMEIQLVHRAIDDATKSLVIAIPVWSETTPQPPNGTLASFLHTPLQAYFPPAMTEPDHNSVLQQFLTARPPTKDGETVDVVIPAAKPLDLSVFVQNPAVKNSGTYIQYSGSLTTPPCSDMTTWFVRRAPMLASDAQTKTFAESVFRLTNKHGNFRAVMPVNQRILKVFRAQWENTLKIGKQRLPLGPNARTDKEYQAEKASRMAKDVSQNALDYMADFGKRLRRSARGLQTSLDKGKLLLVTTPPSTENAWDQAVQRTRANMNGIMHGVKASVDENMRRETMQIHKEAAIESDKARMMTAAWEAAKSTPP